MKKNCKTEVKPHEDLRTSKEWIDKTVSESFDEFFEKISSENKFNKSEELNRDYKILKKTEMWKIYDIINSYHAFCKLCEQHFYSYSVPNDINSFFQNHINTPYHRQIRSAEVLPDDSPIITWEKKFHSGHCNVCQMSGLDSYILHTKFQPMELMKFHFCMWDKEYREANQILLEKYNLLKKYCRLSIFRSKLIKVVEGRNVCILCGEQLSWTGEKAQYHLGSDKHFQAFCFFLRNRFDFSLKDMLNGFNLEMVIRWFFSWDPPSGTIFIDRHERKMCMTQSNSSQNPFPNEKDNCSFSPKIIDSLQNDDIDFIQNNKCLLCNVSVYNGHMKSDLHRLKALNVKEEFFESEKKFAIFYENRRKRQRMLKKYKGLELEDEKLIPSLSPSPSPSPSSSPCLTNKIGETDNLNYFKTLFGAKLDKLNSNALEKKNDWEFFCHICDQKVLVAAEKTHLGSFQHKCESQKWDELKSQMANQKFSETFVKVKRSIVCLLCAALLNLKSLYSHLNSKMHKQKYEGYATLNNTIPLSSGFKVYQNFSWVCMTCGKAMNIKGSPKSMVKKLLAHWPCNAKKEEKTDHKNKSRTSSESRKADKNQMALALCSICGRQFKKNYIRIHAEKCTRNLVDFQKVQKTMENILQVFEEKIMESVHDKSGVFFNQLTNSRFVPARQSRKKEKVNAQITTICTCAQSSSTCPCQGKPIVNGNGEKIEEKFEKLIVNELRVQKAEVGKDLIQEEIETDKNGEVEPAVEDEGENIYDVLVIKGLPRRYRKFSTMLTKFSTYGKIRYLDINKKVVVVAFTEPQVAKIAAKDQTLFQCEKTVSMSVTTRNTRKRGWKMVDEPLQLSEDLVVLLNDPQKLMDFALNLTSQALSISESRKELERQELLCTTINRAVRDCFPLARCYPFGSRLSGLSLNNSDLDVFLDCGDMYEGFKDGNKRSLLQGIASLLKKTKEVSNMNVIPRARVPIISFLHGPTSLNCDLSFKHGLSVQNTLIIKFILSLDWRVRPLILLLKHWAKLCSLHGPPFFSSYALVMLVIFYLEQLENPVLPTIETLQKNYVGRRMTIEGWNCSINTSDIPKFQNRDPLPHILAGLFEFYAEYDYDTYIISPLTGTQLPRQLFTASEFTKLPMSYKRHVLNMPSPIDGLLRGKIPICIIDPLDISHVLTKGFPFRQLQDFKNFCRISAECLRNGLAHIQMPL